MMKKGFSLLLVLTLILSSFGLVASAASGGASQVISEFNIMPQSCSADSDNLVTRREFAYTIANILGSGEAEPRETQFVDVTVDEADSGYIYYATINGFLLPEGNMFCPNDPISLYDFNDAVIKLLAYETIAQANGGGVDGAIKTVRDLKIYNKVTINNYETVTVKQYRQLIYNLMTADITEFNYSYDKDGNINLSRTGATKTILSQYFGISRYYGSIVDVNNLKPSARFKVTKNVSEANPEILAVNQEYDFLSNGKVDMNFYKNIPVEIWIDSDGVIVYIAPQQNVEVFYDVIYSVNNDTNPDNAYALNLVESIELNRDEKEYKIDPKASVSYNGAITKTPVKLAGKYAKIVLINNKITFIETWNLQEGGMVREVNNSYISFFKGEAEGRVKKIGEYENIMVIIDGRSTDRTQIKPGSLFYYYQTDDQLVVVVSEKTISGNLESMSTDEMEIGRHFYPTNGDIYVSEDGGESYVTNNFDGVFGNQVLCYVDIFGDIRYMRALDELNKSNEFTAYIIGSSQKGFEDIKIKVQKLYPDVEEATITLPTDLPASKIIDNPATAINDIATVFSSASSIAANAMKWSDKMNATNKLYKFTVDDEGVITQIAEPDYYLLFGEEHDVTYLDDNKVEQTMTVPCLPAINIPLDHFTGDYRAIYLPDTKTNGITTGIGSSLASTQLFYIRNERFIILTNIDGKLGVMEKSYNELLAHGTFNMSDESLKVNIAMFAKPEDSTPAFWFLYGNTDKIRRHNGDDDATIDSITLKYDAEKDKNYYEVVLDGGDMEWELDTIVLAELGLTSSDITHYRPSSEPAPDKLEVGMKVEYMDGALFCNNEVYITGVEEYPKSASGADMTIDEWYQNIMPGMLRGTLKKITDYRLFLENGAAYHIGNNCNIVGVKFKNGKVEYVDLTEADLEAGSTIYYNRNINVNAIYVEIVD